MTTLDLVPGKTYKVSFHDCCAEGFFTSRFVEYELDEDGDPYEMVFADARLGPMWGPIEASEVTEVP